MSEHEKLTNQLQLIIQKAFRSIDAAHRNIAQGDYDFGASRAYYAAFYAMEAVLITKGLSFSKHAGVVSAFNQHFVKTGIFRKEFSKFISRLFRERQAGDYDFELSINEEDAKEDVRIAEIIVKAVVRYLDQEGYKIDS